ncbi:MAG: NERD domain-containing protein [Actinomycetota bacterium]|nr:NERD domain-containing protein [Actinomycetota bacterium]
MALSVSAFLVLLWLVWPEQTLPLWGAVLLAVVTSVAVSSDTFYGTYQTAMGRDAEEWTSKELRKRCPREWRVIDWIPFGDRDVDHVVIGTAGVYAIETKYTDSDVDLETPWGRRDVEGWSAQAARNARTIRLRLRSAGVNVEVDPVVVVWGRALAGTPTTVADVSVWRGQDLRDGAPWAAAGTKLSNSEIDRAVLVLMEHRADRLIWEKEHRRTFAGRGAGYCAPGALRPRARNV